MKKVIILTSVHVWNDTRIFFKEALSLAKRFDVELYAPADFEFKEVSNVKIFGLPKWKKRVDRRYIRSTIWKRIRNSKAFVYHLHDPELIPIGIKLKKLGKKVIFDVHENISLQIKSKEYIPKFLRRLVSFLYRVYEIYSLKYFDCLILAEKSYRNYYKDLSDSIYEILNMPKINFFDKFYSNKRFKNEIFYIGRISDNRGFDITIKALRVLKKYFPNVLLKYIGPYEEKILSKVNTEILKQNIKFFGRLPLDKGYEYSKNSKVGISLLKPIANYKNSYSTKIFEYMAVGLPVVTSNFKIYEDIVEKSNCGICVNPYNYHEVAKAIQYIFSHPKKASIMGRNGRRLIEKKYNWKNEEKKLFALYQEIK